KVNFWIRSDVPSLRYLGQDLANSINTIIGRTSNGRWAVATCGVTYADVVAAWFESTTSPPTTSPFDHIANQAPFGPDKSATTQDASTSTSDSPYILCYQGDPLFTGGYFTNVWNIATAKWSVSPS